MRTAMNVNPKMVVRATIIRGDGTIEPIGVVDLSLRSRIKIWYINLKRRMKNGKRGN